MMYFQTTYRVYYTYSVNTRECICLSRLYVATNVLELFTINIYTFRVSPLYFFCECRILLISCKPLCSVHQLMYSSAHFTHISVKLRAHVTSSCTHELLILLSYLVKLRAHLASSCNVLHLLYMIVNTI